MPETGEVTLIPQGEECDVEWRMNFASISDEDHAVYTSPQFSFEGETLCLGIQLNKMVQKNSNTYIQLYIWQSPTNNSSHKNMSFIFSFKTLNGQKKFKRQCTGFFVLGKSCSSDRFLSKSYFQSRQSEFLDSGFLKVVCTLKSLNSTGSASNSATEGCSYSKRNLAIETLFSRKKKCWDKSIKCPKCFTVIVSQNGQAESVKDNSSLCKDFKEMLFSGLNHDLILKIGNKELKAHQDVLRTRSHVFKSMLNHDTKEKKSGIIDIPDCDPQAMEQFLCFIYSGQVDALEESNMFNLYYIADKYDVKELKGICCAFIRKSLSNSNIYEIIQFAMLHSDSTLLEHATEYFTANALDIMRTVEWQTFMKDNLTVANELTIKSIEKLKNANT